MPGNEDPIIIGGRAIALDPTQFTAEQVAVLREIAARTTNRMTYKDTLRVCKIIHKKLRGP
jgi:hypothetical protein